MKSPLLYVGLLIVFALTTALVVPLFINWSNYRADIEAYGERMTGRQVKVNGDISLRLLPAPILRLGDVRVSNPVEAAAPDLLVARTIEAKLALAPLLRGKVEITTVEVDSPVIEAESLPGGGTWELSPMGGFERLLEVEDIRLVDARITSGTMVVRDPSRDFVARLEDLDMSLEAPSLAGPFKAKGAFTHDGVRRDFGLSVGRRREDRPTHLAVTLAPGSGWGKEYALDGTVETAEGGPRFTGRMRIVEAEAEEEGKQDKVDVGLDQIVPFELRSDIVATLDEAILDDVQFIFGSGRSRATMTGSARIDIWNGPRLDAKLSARRLDLDAVVASQVEGVPQATPSTRDILNQIPRLLEFLPKTLSGQLAMDVDGLVLGGHQIEGAGVTLRFAPGALTVSRAVGRLPGQTQVSVTGTYRPDATETDFEGIFSLQARDAKTFLTWLAPRLETVIDPEAGGARGNLSLQGELRVRKTLVELIGVEATIDKSKARLGLSVALTERPAFGLRVVLDEFNLDRYLPPRGKAGEKAAEPTTEVVAKGGNPLSILGEFDANLVVRATQLIARGTTMRDISADLTLRGGNLDVKQFTVADLGGARINLKGKLTDVVHSPEGRIEASLDADDPSDFVDLIAGGRADAADERWTGWGPAKFMATLDAVAGETPKITLVGSGTLGGTTAEVDGAFEGSLDAPAEARTSLQVALANDKGQALLRQIGVAADAPAEGSGRPGVLRGAVSGTLSEGLNLSVGVEALGAEASIDGMARRIAGTTSLEAEVKLAAADAGPLYRALDLTTDGDAKAAGGLDLRALVAGKDAEFVITGLTGTVAEVPVNVNGIASLGGAVPEFRLTANVARMSLPWALGVLVAGDGSIENPVALAVAATGSSSTAVPVWSPLPFRTGNLNRLALELEAEVGTLDIGGGLSIRGASFDAELGGGGLKLTDVKGQLFGGTVGFTASLAATRDQVTLKSEYALEEADLAELSGFVAAEPAVTGTVTLRGEVRGSGRNMHALMSSLSGEGKIAVADMALQRFDAPAFAEALREARDEEQVQNVAETVLAGGALEVGPQEVGYTVASGLVRLEPIDVKAEAVSGRMSTLVDLAAWRFDNEWQLSFAKIANAPALTVSIGGLVGDGARNLDIRELKTFMTMKALHEDMVRLEEMERRAREQIRKEEEAFRRIEEEARREREQEEREALEREARQHQTVPRAANETTLVPQTSPDLDQPLMPRGGTSEASDGQGGLPKQVDRIGPAQRSDDVIRVGPDGRLRLPQQSSESLLPSPVEKQVLPPPGQ